MLDITQIQKVLPHRYPFLLVDRITHIKQGEFVEGFKNISISEPAFMGHFPDHPIYPGVMILEGMAQAGGILAFKSSDIPEEELKNKVIYFMSIDKAKFRKPVVPGDRLDYKIKIVKLRQNLIILDGKAYVNDTLVAQAELKAMIVDK